MINEAMFKTLSRKLKPNTLESLLRKAEKKQQKRFLLCWNRGLGDIALGLFAIFYRIREKIPDAEISVLCRENLKEGFALLPDIKIIIAPGWRRGVLFDTCATLKELKIPLETFDAIFETPEPNHWVPWQLGKLTPRLQWKSEWDSLWREFPLHEDFIYIGIQPQTETNYALWRNWPIERWNELLDRLEMRPSVRVILFGVEASPSFSQKGVIDLRGKTNLFQMLSIIKNRLSHLIVLDSGILSMIYYLDIAFPLHLISLWGDLRHGILRQKVSSPNPLLHHEVLFGERNNLSSVNADDVLMHLFPEQELKK